METVLNLLSPEKKKALRRLYLVLFCRQIMEVLIFYSAIIAVVLVLVNIHLRGTLENLYEKTSALDESFSKINQQIKTVNQQLHNINLAQESVTDWTPWLEEIFNKTPASVITLKILNMDKNNKTALIQGRAKTREALLDYKAALEKLPFLRNLQIPVSALTTKENIDFNFNPTLIFSP